MGTAERRTEIMRILCRRRHETISNLADEFGVSSRTILRDIEVLSITEPIYTKCGRYDGGIYVADDFVMNRMYMTDIELHYYISWQNLPKTNLFVLWMRMKTNC